jgi:hypothetical protein
VPAVAALLAAYGVSTIVAWVSNDREELATEVVSLTGLTALALSRDPRWLLVLVVPIPAFVLLHERIPVDHWIAYGPAALSLALAGWADRAWRGG